jgi:hypothetical protein
MRTAEGNAISPTLHRVSTRSDRKVKQLPTRSGGADAPRPRVRHALLGELILRAPAGVEVSSFEDGTALSDAIVDRVLEGVPAKREREPYRSGGGCG